MNSLPSLDQLKSESVRLETFSQWPQASPIDPSRLAKSGFYYIGPSDRVRCAFCNGILKSWLPNDNPDVEHRNHFPQCPFVLGHRVGNIPVERSNVPPRPSSLASSLSSVGVLSCPDMADVQNRMSSMENLPASVKQDRQVLAEAGFFYTGHGDSMRCFSCGGALRNWQSDDDPWIEHARWFPRCQYVRQQKGDDFVNDIEANFKRAMSSASVPMSPQSEYPAPHQVPHQAPRRRNEELSPMIQAVVSMGYSEDLVQRVLLDLKRIRGPHGTVDVQSLMTAVMDEEERRNQGSGSPSQNASGSGASRDPEDRIICKICMEREVEVTFLPCGHLVCCEQCSRHVTECPVCRKRIRGSVRTFLA